MAKGRPLLHVRGGVLVNFAVGICRSIRDFGDYRLYLTSVDSHRLSGGAKALLDLAASLVSEPPKAVTSTA